MTPHAAHATGSARGTSGSEDATSSISGARRFADGLKRLLALFHYFAYGGIAAIMSITWMALLVASVLQFQSETGLRFYDSLAAGFHALNTLALFSTVLGVLLGGSCWLCRSGCSIHWSSSPACGLAVLRCQQWPGNT